MVLNLNLTAEQALRLLPSTPVTHKVTTGPSIVRDADSQRQGVLPDSRDALHIHWVQPTALGPYGDISEREIYPAVAATGNMSSGIVGNFTSALPENASQAPVAMDINEDLRKAEIGVLAAILYLALFGNGMVLLILRLRRQMLSRMQWFIAHLAIADMFVAFFNVLPQLMWDIFRTFYGNDILCKGVAYFQLVAMYASSWVLVMAAVDRYVSICHPLTSQTLTPKRVHLMISLAWSLSLVFSLPQFFIFSYTDPTGDGYTCYAEFVEGWGVQAYVVWVFVSDYAVPFLILAFCYGRICHVVWISVGAKESKVVYRSVRNGAAADAESRPFRFRISFHSSASQRSTSLLTGGERSLLQDRKRPTSGSSRSGSSSVSASNSHLAANSSVSESKKPRAYQRGVSRSKIKTIKLTLTVVLCYLICWAPYFFVQLYTVFGGSKYLEHPAVVLLMLMASLNSCTNPWIYLAFSSCKCPRGQQTRQVSRSWAISTHVTSAADSHDRDVHGQSHSQVGARSSNMSVNSTIYHHNSSSRNNRRPKCSHH